MTNKRSFFTVLGSISAVLLAGFSFAEATINLEGGHFSLAACWPNLSCC